MREQIFIVGCGDVGRRVARLEQTKGRRVAALARSEISERLLRGLSIEPVKGDLDRLETLVAFPDAGSTLYYFAPPPASGNGDSRLEAWLQALPSDRWPARVIYISTSGVYGDCGGAWVDEGAPLLAQSDRARRRVAAEASIATWSEKTGVRSVRLRVPGIYGPGRLPLERLKVGRPVVCETESAYSNRIHADDLAHICFVAAHHPSPGAVYNVSDGHPTTMTDYFNRVADLAGLPRPPQIPMAEARRIFDSGLLSFLEESKRLDNRRMLKELQVSLRYPTLVEGLPACL